MTYYVSNSMFTHLLCRHWLFHLFAHTLMQPHVLNSQEREREGKEGTAREEGGEGRDDQRKSKIKKHENIQMYTRVAVIGLEGCKEMKRRKELERK